MDETKDTPDRRKAQVTLYTRPGCHLCDEAKRAMLESRCEDLYALLEVNIDSDPELVRRYGWDIPVVLINGVQTFKHRLTSSDFERELRHTINGGR